MRREIAIIGIIAGLGIGILGGWFIPAPVFTTHTPLLDKIIDRGELLVGTSADYPPFENKTWPGGEIVGFDIDLSQMIADEIGSGVTLTMVDLPFDSLIPACKAGTVDMLAAGLSYTEERAEELAASITYINVSQVVIAKNDSGYVITDITDVTAYDVGVQTATVMYDELDDLGMTLNVDLFTYDNAIELMAALDGGAIDLAYIDGPVFTAWEGIYTIEVLYSSGIDPFAIFTRHGEPEFLYLINTVIYESYLTESIFDIMNSWFGNITS
ncbi:MAG: substrate-binding periplasmic protein [Promethearchaeota archaeon]|jgi:polar amino acid transport system substrate-binding protein